MNQVAPFTTAAAAAPGTCDPNEFQLPMDGLFADLEVGSASMRLPDEFLQCSGLVQLKILGDWQRSLERYRRAAAHRLAQELCSSRPDMDDDECLSLLKKTCESLRIELPSEVVR